MRTCHLLTKCPDNASLANTLQITRTKLNKMCSYSMIFDSFLNNFFDESENWFPMRSAFIVKLLLIQYIHVHAVGEIGSSFFLGGGGGPYPSADTGFPEGGGEDIHKHPPPLDIVRDVIRPPKNWKTPPLLGIPQAPPPPLGHCPCDVIHIPRGRGVWSVPVTHTLHTGRFSVSGQVQRGGVIIPVTHTAGSATAIRNQKAGRNKGRAHDLSS